MKQLHLNKEGHIFNTQYISDLVEKDKSQTQGNIFYALHFYFICLTNIFLSFKSLSEVAWAAIIYLSSYHQLAQDFILYSDLLPDLPTMIL